MPLVSATREGEWWHWTLYCLTITCHTERGLWTTLHIYESEKSRANGLKHWQREGKLSDEVFYFFEIPMGRYLVDARKIV